MRCWKLWVGGWVGGGRTIIPASSGQRGRVGGWVGDVPSFLGRVGGWETYLPSSQLLTVRVTMRPPLALMVGGWVGGWVGGLLRTVLPASFSRFG